MRFMPGLVIIEMLHIKKQPIMFSSANLLPFVLSLLIFTNSLVTFNRFPPVTFSW